MDASLHGQAAMAAKGLSVEEYLRAALPGTSSTSSGNGGNGTQSPEVTAFEEKEATRRIRSAVGDALASLAGAHTLGEVGGGPEHPEDDVQGGGGVEKQPLLDEVLEFILSEGLADPSPQVRETMLGAGTSLVDAYAPHSHHASNLLAILEAHMSKNSDRGAASAGAPGGAPAVSSSKKDKGKGNSATNAAAAASKEDPIVLGDRRREGTVALLGTIAKHLDKSDPKVRQDDYGLPIDVTEAHSKTHCWAA